MSQVQSSSQQILSLISKVKQKQLSGSQAPIMTAAILQQIHRIFLQLSPSDVPQVVSSIYSASFTCQLLDFVQSGEAFAYFGLRVLDHMCMHSEIRLKLCKNYLVSFGLVNISLGLLRSGDYDTILAALSLLTSLLTVKEISEFIEYNGIRMISKLLQQKEVEYIYFILQLIDLILNSSRDNRNQILHIGLADALKYNIKNNAELQKCPRLFGQAKRIKDEIEVFESVVANMNASYLISG